MAINNNDFKVCDRCAKVNPVSNTFCVACGGRDAWRSVQSSPRVAVNYNDFKVCNHCAKVCPEGDTCCMACGGRDAWRSIQSSSSMNISEAFVMMFWFLVGILALFFVPIGTVLGAISLFLSYKKFANRHKEEVNRNKDRAVQLFQQMLGNQQSDMAGVYADAQARFNLGDYAMALPLFKRARTLGKNDDQTSFELAVCSYNLKEYQESSPLLENLLGKPNPPHTAEELLARSYLGAGIETEKQIAYLARFRQTAPEKLKNRITLALADNFAARSTTGSEDAREVLHDACQIDPKNANYVAAIARLYLSRDDPGQSLQYCRRLIVEEHGPAGLAVYAKTLHRAALTDEEAVSVYQKYLLSNPCDADIRLQLAQALILKGQVAGAVETYQAGLHLDPRDLRLRYHLALALKMGGETEAAIGELQEIMRTDGFESYRSKDDISRLLSKCFIKKNMLRAAMKQLLTIARSSETLEDLYELGGLFEAAVDPQNARICWEEIYATDVAFKGISGKLN
jgi:thioredoxin-like negative regulator of GroEL